jgi:hypothetical protein
MKGGSLMKPILATFAAAFLFGLGATAALADNHGDTGGMGASSPEERATYEQQKADDMARQEDAMSDVDVSAALDSAWKEVREDWSALEDATAENWDAARETFEESWDAFQEDWEEATAS